MCTVDCTPKGGLYREVFLKYCGLVFKHSLVIKQVEKTHGLTKLQSFTILDNEKLLNHNVNKVFVFVSVEREGSVKTASSSASAGVPEAAATVSCHGSSSTAAPRFKIRKNLFKFDKKIISSPVCTSMLYYQYQYFQVKFLKNSS